MTIISEDGPLDPDWLRGPDLDLVVELFRDVDWRNQDEVDRRASELEAWAEYLKDHPPFV